MHLDYPVGLGQQIDCTMKPYLFPFPANTQHQNELVSVTQFKFFKRKLLTLNSTQTNLI